MQKNVNYLSIYEKMRTFVRLIVRKRVKKKVSLMVILNIETSTDACSAAITEGGKVMEVGGEKLCLLEPVKSEHARQLALFADSLMGRLRAAGKQLEAIAVSEGPGSYTGLRIGASLAKGLAYGLNVPMVAVPTLAVLAEYALASEAEGYDLICPMIDARRMEVYTQLFDKEGKPLMQVEAKVIDETSFAHELSEKRILFLGNGAEKCKAVITSENALWLDNVPVDAACMGRLAEAKMAAGETADVAYWTPFYLKDFEAKKSVVKGLK